jgi:cytochrome c5
LRIEVISMAEQYSSKGIMIATIIVTVVLIAVVVPFSLKGDKSAADANSGDRADSRIQPVAKFELAKAAPAVATGPKDGATVFNTVCGACHNTGVAGAPKAGDKAAWAPRIATGNDALYKSAIGGKGAMPPKGGAADLSDDEIKGAVDHLVGLAK